MRLAIDDVDLAGFTIPAGTLVVVNGAAANRDPAVYDDPDRFDITREAPAGHAEFRRRHALLPRGQPRQNRTRRSVSVITRRMPNPRRTGPAPWKPLTGIGGPASLPIEFDTAQ